MIMPSINYEFDFSEKAVTKEDLRIKANKGRPGDAARAICIECLGLKKFNAEAIRGCQGDQAFIGPCPIFPNRLGGRISVKAIRAYCLQSMGGSKKLVRECDRVECSAHKYRMGKNPEREGMEPSRKSPERGREKGKTAPESNFL